MKIVALAGGVGGAKLAHGLAQILPPENLTVIVNTGDDFEHLGLTICPDLDTVCYTLAGLANPDTGWGRENETWNTISNIETLGGPNWFRVGDRDLATHLERTRRLKEGKLLSQVTKEFSEAWGIQQTIFPMSDSAVRTIVETDAGDLAFQEYFVHLKCEPKVKGFRFEGIENAKPVSGARAAIESAQAVVICPSNPWVSIDPILRVLKEINKPVVAISPIIGGKTVKGPAAKMYAELGIEPSALAVALHYKNLLSGFVFDNQDRQLSDNFKGCKILSTDTIMNSPADRARLAMEVLQFVGSL